jgi:hypothetical protein
MREDILMGTVKGGLIIPENYGRDIAEIKEPRL